MPEITNTEDNNEPVTGVRLVKAQTFELDPSKFYVMLFDRRSITREDVHSLGLQLKAQGIKGLSVMLMGDPGTVKIVETESKK